MAPLGRRQALGAGLTAALGLGALTGCAPSQSRREGDAWAREVEAALTALEPIESAKARYRTNFAESTKVGIAVIAHPKDTAAGLSDTATTVLATIAAHPIPESLGIGPVVTVSLSQALPLGMLRLVLAADHLEDTASHIAAGVAELENGAHLVALQRGSLTSDYRIISEALLAPVPDGASGAIRRGVQNNLAVGLKIDHSQAPPKLPIVALAATAATFADQVDIKVKTEATTETEMKLRPRIEEPADPALVQGMEEVLRSLRTLRFSPPLAVYVVEAWWTTFSVGDPVQIRRGPPARIRPTVEPIITALLDRVNR